MTVRETAKRHAPRSLLAWRHRRHQWRVVKRHGWDRVVGDYVAEHGLTVQAGPFAGMRLPECVATWEQCAAIPWLRGNYEREIHPFLVGEPRPFVNIGCAEGTYLVGMALRGCRATGFEIDRVRRARARRLAQLNGVTVWIRGAFDPAGIDLAGATVLVDIEGAEVDLLHEHADLFSRSLLIVEFHGDSEGAVVSALRSTHEVAIVPFEPRSGLDEEHRPLGQSWGVFSPR
jgi:hypothetical protein